MPRQQHALPRWRGFNLLEMFTTQSHAAWQETDFAWTAEWGLDFIRLPMCYLLWTDPRDVYSLHEQGLARIDEAVLLAAKSGLHLNLNLHRGPGYSVNRERAEPFDLWHDSAALDAFIFHWQALARRYAGVSSERMSFNLINEPPPLGEHGFTRQDHQRVIRATVAAIRAISPDRLIIIDGVEHARLPCPELADLGVAQSCRAYSPLGISHYRASWAAGVPDTVPTWPGGLHYGKPWDQSHLQTMYDDWAALSEAGVGVHCGEGGAYIHTPHDVFIAWFRDVLEALKARNIGWALWNLRGSFGVLDSNRPDVAYEEWRGHRLDRQLLDLLQSH